MREYGFSRTHMLTYKDRITDSVLIQENTGQLKPTFSQVKKFQEQFKNLNIIFILQTILKYWALFQNSLKDKNNI